MSRSAVARALASALLLILPTMFAGSLASVANAQPGDAADPPAANVTLAWPTLGLDRQIFLGANSSTSFTVPVPAGLNAVRLQGLIHAPMNISAGYLEINDGDGKFLAAVDLPPATSSRAVTPLDVDVSAARARASTIKLSFTVRPQDNANQFCGPLQQLLLSDLSTVFSGAESPATTIAAFFPPVLEQVSIYAPTDADAAEQQAVLTLVSTLGRFYNPQPLAIPVATQPRGATPAPAGPLTRTIVVEAGRPAGLRVENPGSPGAYLRVSGSGDELTTQVSLLVNQLQTLAQTSATRVDQAGSDTAKTGDTLTFSQLRMSGKTDVLRTGTMTVGVGRAALGSGRVENVQVHLLADYTPVPKDDAASVVIRSQDVVVYRGPLDNTGRLDATFDLGSHMFGQYLNLDFALTYTPQQTCGPLVAPVTFQVDPRSTLTIQRGGVPLNGFSAFPSEFSPSFMVALDGSGPNQLTDAARIVAAIARLTNQQLTPQVVDLKTATDATSGALIVAKSAALAKTSLNPPVRSDGTAVDLGLPTELRADIEDGLGSIQAFADPQRNRSVVLVTTTDEWSLVSPLFTYLEGLGGGWSELSGDVLAAGAAGTPTNVAIRADAGTTEDTEPTPMRSTNRWLPIGLGIAVAAALAILATALLSRGRRASARVDTPDDAPSDPAQPAGRDASV